jgi:hypothetical protein
VGGGVRQELSSYKINSKISFGAVKRTTKPAEYRRRENWTYLERYQIVHPLGLEPGQIQRAPLQQVGEQL